MDCYYKADVSTHSHGVVLITASEHSYMSELYYLFPDVEVCFLMQTFVLDKEGKVILSYQGPKGSDPKEHIKKSLEALKSKSGSGGGLANDASKAGQNAPKAGSMESLKNLPDEANESYTGAETLK